jgi:serine/threonine protein kinase
MYGNNKVKIIDFGVSKCSAQNETLQTTMSRFHETTMRLGGAQLITVNVGRLCCDWNHGNAKSFLVGTPLYQAPEILSKMHMRSEEFRQNVFLGWRRVDVYSFGILLYELFTRKIPWEGLVRDETELQLKYE